MITTLDLGTFKAFKELKGLRLTPLTILSGTNSSGKSSILQSLLLLKQSLSGEIEDEALILDGNYIQFSSLREASFGLPSENSALISFGFELGTEIEPIGHLYFEIRNKKLQQHTERCGPVVTYFSWREAGRNKERSVKRYMGKYRLSANEELGLPKPPPGFELGKHRLIQFEHFLPAYLLHEAGKPKESGEHFLLLPLRVALRQLSKLVELLRDELNNMKYLGPSRAIPRRAYTHYTERHYDLDPDGGNAAQVFWLRKNELIKWHEKQIPLKEAVSECLSILGFKQGINSKRSSNIVYQLLVNIHNAQNKQVTIADVGFGYSQVLPIILCALLADENALILLEQPEIHLHPSAKAKLADLFVAFYRSGRRLIVETHSTELINGLQLQVIHDPTLKDKINVVFVTPSSETDASGAQIKQLSLQADGMFDEWPEGFCDESERLARRILSASVQKARTQE